jgi:hypothetical protein
MAWNASKERRQRRRFTLPWTVSLLRDGSFIECPMRDISSGGLCCLSGELFQPGDRLQCRIAFPAESAGMPAPVYLFCELEVIEVETGLQEGYGLHCRFDDYRLIAG